MLTTGTHTFTTSAAAWAYMRQVDEARESGREPGLYAGFPSLRAPYTVKVGRI
jgi:hypothetical protein